MKERIARGIAAGCALLLVIAYFLCPAAMEENTINNSGRKKLELTPGEELQWNWTPEKEGTDAVTLFLSGTKKAQEMTIQAEITGPDGAAAAAETQAVADLGGGGDHLRLAGEFRKGTAYTLKVRAEGEGSLKLKGEEDPETEAFYPMISENAVWYKKNNILLYFALGALLAAATPVFGAPGRKRAAPAGKGVSGLLERALPWATFGLIAGVGIFITAMKPMFVTGEAWNSWDEEVHWAAIQSMSLFQPGGIRALAAELTSANPGYVPLAIGYNLGRIFTADESSLYHAAIACSTLCYAAMCALAVWRAPRYKATFLVAATLPTLLFLMTSASYDTVTTGSMLLGTALVLEIMDQKEKISSMQAITAVCLLAFGTVAKELYSPILFFALLIPNDKFRSKREAWGFRALVLAFFVWCAGAILVPGIDTSVWTGDARFPDASTPDQLRYMLANPIEGGLKPIRTLLENLSLWVKDGISHWAYLGNNYRLNSVYLWLLLVVAPLCTLGENGKGKSLMTPVRRIFLAVIAAGCECLFAYALYLMSSPVGGDLAGMQARYFMPVWGLMALALMWPQRIRQRMGKMGDWMTAAAWAICLAGNLQNAMMHMTATGLL